MEQKFSTEELDRARQALERLVQLLVDQPAVSLIDLGLDPESPQGKGLALRVHLRQPSAKKDLPIPTEIDGIPVRVLTGDYRIER